MGIATETEGNERARKRRALQGLTDVCSALSPDVALEVIYYRIPRYDLINRTKLDTSKIM